MLLPWVKEYVGIPFSDLGRTREEGVDCWGLVRLVYDEVYGVLLPQLSDQYESAHHYRKVAQTAVRRLPLMFAALKERELEEVLKHYPVIALLHERGLPLHVALCAGEDMGRSYVLHTTRGRGHSHLERLDGLELSNSRPKYLLHRSHGVDRSVPV